MQGLVLSTPHFIYLIKASWTDANLFSIKFYRI